MAPCVPIVLAALACVSSSRLVERTFDAASVARATVDLAAGDAEVRASPSPRAELVAELTARAGSRAEADRRLAEVAFAADLVRDRLAVRSSGPAGTRTDLSWAGPSDLDLDLTLGDGSATLEGTRGAHTVRARGVRGRALRGTVDVQASGEGVDLELFPDGPCVITAAGPLVVSLPYGLDYDLVVRPDPEWGAEVTDLGFHDLVQTEQLVEGRAGSASLRVELRAFVGPVVVLEATP